MASDRVTPFAFESFPVRGALIELTQSWQRMQQNHDYDQLLTETLGQAAAATGLIAQSLKFEGSITLQIQGAGALQVLVMQCSSDLDFRGMATLASGASPTSFDTLTRGANCAITVDHAEQPYQGIVSIDGASLAASLKHYFENSVQVHSHVVLLASESVAAGLLLQQMPGEAVAADDWNRLGFLAATLALADFAADTGMALLKRMFSEDDIRVYNDAPLRFQCRCSRRKVEDVLRMLGEDEARAALAARGHIEVTCEFCGQARRFDAIDAERLFHSNVFSGPASMQ